jgi:hypothetical protein
MFTTNDFIPTVYSQNKVAMSAPSNIALVNIGEKGNQIPAIHR